MFYRPENGCDLPHNPFSAIVAPRPIGWISTRGRDGDNLSPYSFFNATAYSPPQVMFSSVSSKPDRDGTKDSVAHIAETRMFCVNIAPADMARVLNDSSAALPAGVSEFETVGIASAECETIDCPRVADAAAALECRMTQILQLPGRANILVLGVVTGVHINETCLVNGRFDPRPRGGWLSRLGYLDFAAVTGLFEQERPE